MRKYYFTLVICFIGLSAVAQNRVGLKFSPNLSFNRVSSDSDVNSYSTNGVGARFIFGPTFDYFLAENYYIGTGIFYAPKRVGVQANNVERSYNLQYIQIPATLKLYTNELSLDTRLYFQLGGILEFKINEKANDEGPQIVNSFTPIDFATTLGMGIEYHLGINTTFYGGLSYNRGLINVVSKRGDLYDKFNIKNDLLNLDIGIRF